MSIELEISIRCDLANNKHCSRRYVVNDSIWDKTAEQQRKDYAQCGWEFINGQDCCLNCLSYASEERE